MKSDWKECKLGDLCRPVSETYHGNDSHVVLINTSDVLEGKVLNHQKVENKALKGQFKKTFQKDDILYSEIRPANRRFAFVDFEDTSRYVASTKLMVLRPNKEKVSPRFLFSILTSSDVIKELQHLAETRSGTFPQITFSSELANIPVALPPFEAQNKIVSILSSLDDKIELNDRINANLEEQAKAIFKSWFVDNALDAWKRGTFSDIIDGMLGGDWGKDSPSGNNSQVVYCIRGADIPDVCKGDKGEMPIRYILPKNFETKRLVDGDIVVEISGGSPTQSTGRAAIITQSLLDRYDNGVVCTNFCRAIKPKKGYSMFVYHYWQYLYDIDLFFSYENGTTGIKNLDISGVVKTEKISIAPKELVEKFNAVCDTIYGKIFENGLENEKLASLRDALLPRLLSGELEVSELNI